MFGIIGQVAGGLGIFLIAVGMMTNGLRLAGGDTLRDILASWTRTPLRALGSGTLITLLVQSSSAVTVATIGFVNAGLMSLSQAIGVVYGANLGTTMTGWLVAALGFEIRVEAFALPLVGLGMILRLVGARRRMGFLGEALAGFGLFFIGIDVLKVAFEGLATEFDLAALATGGGVAGALLFVVIGFLLTVLTQSSSAAIALTLTAATGGLLTLPAAASMVIGANLGTTSTAAFAALGATPNAKRVAAAHVVFNLVTAAVALVILPVMLWIVGALSDLFHLGHAPAVSLALFHTVFNILGIIVLWPFTGRLTRFLAHRFLTVEEEAARPRFLDRTLAGGPALALDALALELGRLRDLTRGIVDEALGEPTPRGRARLAQEAGAVESLALAVGEFVSRIEGREVESSVAEALPQALRSAQHFNVTAERALEAGEATAQLRPPTTEALRLSIMEFHDRLGALLREEAMSWDVRMTTTETAYSTLKTILLRAGADRELSIPEMSGWLEQISRQRHLVVEYLKGAQRLAELVELKERNSGTGNADVSPGDGLTTPSERIGAAEATKAR